MVKVECPRVDSLDQKSPTIAQEQYTMYVYLATPNTCKHVTTAQIIIFMFSPHMIDTVGTVRLYPVSCWSPIHDIYMRNKSLQ